MSPLAQYIQTVIQTALPETRVYYGRPFITHDRAVIEMLCDNKKTLNCVTIERTAARETTRTNMRHQVDTTWQIEVYLAVAKLDANYERTNNNIEILRDAFRRDDSLGNLIATQITETNAGLQLEKLDYVFLFEKLLCHRARMTLTTREQIEK